MGLERTEKILIGTTVGGVVLLILGCVLGFAVFPVLIEDQLIANTQLENGTDQFKRFEKLPIKLPIKVTLFEVTNPDAVILGDKPTVTEKGPYVYDQDKYKQNMMFQGEDSIRYYQHQNVNFNLKASLGPHDVTIKMPNVALLATSQMIESLPIKLPVDYNNVIETMFGNKNLFVDVKIEDILLNGIPFCKPAEIENNLGARLFCLFVRLMNLKNINYSADKNMYFSFLDFKRKSHDGLWRVNTGKTDPKELGKLISWNDGEYTDFWNGGNSVCNKAQGRDSTIYPPLIEEGEDFVIFSTDLCRTFPLNYLSEAEFKGIKGYRYEAPLTMFTEKDPKNSCYCIKKTKGMDGKESCFLDGVIDLHSCFGVPLLASLPHFLNADKKYIESVIGLKPDQSKHKSYAEIEPNTGSPLRGTKRVQFNLVTRPMSDPSSSTSGFLIGSDTLAQSVIPLIWIEEGVELSDALVDELNSMFFDVLTILEAVKWALIGIAIAMIVLSVIFYFVYRNKKA